MRDPRACARGWWLVVVGVLLLVATTGAPVVAHAGPAAVAPPPDPTIVAGDLPGAQPTDPWLGGKRDAAALSTCTSGVPLMSKLGYLNTGADPADPRFAVRGGTFRLGFVATAPQVSSVVLLGDTPEQSAQAVTSLGSAEFASCFSRRVPPLCAADHAQCLGVVVTELPSTPIVGDGRRVVAAQAGVIEEGGTPVPLENTLILSIVQVGTAVGILATYSYGSLQLPETLRIHLMTLLAQRMKGLPLGVDAPSPRLQPGQQPGGALTWGSGPASALPAGTVAAWDADNGHVIGYASPATSGAPGKTLELQSADWVPLTSAHRPAVVAETLAYDDANGQLLLLGDANGVQQTWSWDGADWTQHPGPSPGYRTGAAFTYDNAQTRLVLFGGQDQQGRELGDTWVWEGRSWSQLQPSGPAPRGGQASHVPSPRDHAALAYDPHTLGLVLFGGYTNGNANDDTWLLTGSSWQKGRPNRSPPAGSYWMVYMPNSGQAVLLGRDGSGTWQQWTYNEADVTWRAVLSTATPPLTAFWPVFEPSTQRLFLLPTTDSGSIWAATYYSLDAEPTTPCTTYDVVDTFTAGGEFLVLGGSQEKTTDMSLAADGTAAVTYRQRDAAGPQVDLALVFDSGVGLDASFYAQNVFDRGTGFAFTGTDAQQSAVTAANSLHDTGQPPSATKGPDTVYTGGGVEVGGGLSVSFTAASAGIQLAFAHVAGVSHDLTTGDYSVESETETTFSSRVSFVLGWTPAYGGEQKLSEDFSSDGHPVSLTASWAGQANSAFDLAAEVDSENFLAPATPAAPSSAAPVAPAAPAAPSPAAPNTEPSPVAGAPAPEKQPESRLLKQAANASIDQSATTTHERIMTVEHRWSLTGAGGSDLLAHMDDPLVSDRWMATHASSATTVFLLNDVLSTKTANDATFTFLLTVGYHNDNELIHSSLVSAAYLPPSGAPTSWVACTTAIGRP